MADPYLHPQVRSFLHWCLLPVLKEAPRDLAGLEREALQALLPALRSVCLEMVERKELELRDGKYQVTGLVPVTLDHESSLLRYGELEVVLSTYGHTVWKFRGAGVAGPRHISIETLQEEMKRVESWCRSPMSLSKLQADPTSWQGLFKHAIEE